MPLRIEADLKAKKNLPFISIVPNEVHSESAWGGLYWQELEA